MVEKSEEVGSAVLKGLSHVEQRLYLLLESSMS
jgi:hypothetical protein